MKNVIFFPFSHVSPEQIKTLTSFFVRIDFLNLNREFLKEPELHRRVDQGDLNPVNVPVQRLVGIEKQVQSYQEWAQLHRGNEKNLKSLLRDTPYMTDEEGLSSIQSLIRDAGAEKSPSRSVKDPLLFLKFAEIWDTQNQRIHEELLALETGTKSLFAELKGEVGAPAPGTVETVDMSRSDPGEAMTGERILAWAEIAAEIGLFAEEGELPLLVTTSPGVLEYLVSGTDPVINDLDIESIKVHENGCENKEQWHREMNTIFDGIIAGRNPSITGMTGGDDLCCGAGQLRCCLLSGGRLNETLKIPGKQLAVCLVQLNS